MQRLSTDVVSDNIPLSDIKKEDEKMSSKLTDKELTIEIASRFPEHKKPIFAYDIDKRRIDFEDGPIAILDESEDDYGLKASQIISASTPAHTQRAYKGDIQYFFKWVVFAISPKGKWPIDEEDILKFIIQHLEPGEMPKAIDDALVASGMKKFRGVHSLATVRRRLVCLSMMHKLNNGVDPCDSQKVKSLLSAMQKKYGQQKKSKAITKNILESLVETCESNRLIDIRDKAILLFGWASGGRRRSEIVDAVIGNLEETCEGNYLYRLERSKTDQRGEGLFIPINGVAAKSLRLWLERSSVKDGEIFRSVSKGEKIGMKLSDVDVNRIVKTRIKKAGYDEKLYSAHSLRSGFVTEGGKRGIPLGDIMAITGHRGVRTVMGYYQAGCVTNNKAANMMDK